MPVGVYGPLINQSERAYNRSHIIKQVNDLSQRTRCNHNEASKLKFYTPGDLKASVNEETRCPDSIFPQMFSLARAQTG